MSEKYIEIILTDESDLDHAKIEYDNMIHRLRNLLDKHPDAKRNNKSRIQLTTEKSSEYMWLYLNDDEITHLNTNYLDDNFEMIDSIIGMIEELLNDKIIHPNDYELINAIFKFFIISAFIELYVIIKNLDKLAETFMDNLELDHVERLRIFIPKNNLKFMNLKTSNRDYFYNAVFNSLVAMLIKKYNKNNIILSSIVLNTNMYQTHEYLSRSEFINSVNKIINENSVYNDTLNYIYEETDAKDVLDEMIEDYKNPLDLDENDEHTVSKPKRNSIFVDQKTKYIQ